MSINSPGTESGENVPNHRVTPPHPPTPQRWQHSHHAVIKSTHHADQSGSWNRSRSRYTVDLPRFTGVPYTSHFSGTFSLAYPRRKTHTPPPTQIPSLIHHSPRTQLTCLSHYSLSHSSLSHHNRPDFRVMGRSRCPTTHTTGTCPASLPQLPSRAPLQTTELNRTRPSRSLGGGVAPTVYEFHETSPESENPVQKNPPRNRDSSALKCLSLVHVDGEVRRYPPPASTHTCAVVPCPHAPTPPWGSLSGSSNLVATTWRSSANNQRANPKALQEPPSFPYSITALLW
jgi:hypothetical protein